MKLEKLEAMISPTSLAGAFLHNSPIAEDFYTYRPYKQDSFIRRNKQIDNYYHLDRSRLAKTLAAYNKYLGCSEETLSNIELLQQEDTKVVVTGQQAGILTGPLYTLHKAISTIKLAKEMTKKLKLNVVPVFWIASEDHDYHEINHAYHLNHKGRIERLSLPFIPLGSPSIGQIELGSWAQEFIDIYSTNLPNSEYKDQILKLLQDTCNTAKNLADWFAKIMTVLFSKYGLIILDPMLPELRKLQIPFLKQVIKDNDDIEKSVIKAGQDISSQGFTMPIDWRSNTTGLFTLVEGQRLPIIKERDCYQVKGSSICWGSDEMLHQIEIEPEMFSTNVALRPIGQDYLLPVLAYVAGPGEIAYYAQLKNIYPIFGLEMPIVFPRLSMTIITSEQQTILNKLDLKFKDIRQGFDPKAKLEQLSEIDFEAKVEQAKEAIESIHANLIKELEKVDQDLGLLQTTNWNRISYQLDYLSNKTWQKLRKQHSQLFKESEILKQALFPANKPQERVYNVFSISLENGFTWINELVEKDFEPGPYHWLVYLEQLR